MKQLFDKRISAVSIFLALLMALGVVAPIPVSLASEMPSQDSKLQASTASPRIVEVGLYLSDVPEVNLREGVFAFDLYLWLRWEPSQFLATGAETPSSAGGLPRAPADTYEIMGVHELTTTPITSDPGYSVFRIQGKVRETFELGSFPFDSHRLHLKIEDSESEIHEILLKPDIAQSKSRVTSIPGWQVGVLTIDTGVDEFNTNFGDPTIPSGSTAQYSYIEFSLPIENQGWAYCVKLGVPVVIAVLLAMYAFYIPPTDVDPRFGLPVGGLFAAVGSQWIVSAGLPDRTGLTLADWVHVISFIVILMVVAVSVRSLRLAKEGRDAEAEKLDSKCRKLFPTMYLLACATAVLLLR